ncbi:venom dipeptidyl peptidase 4-like isoform X1 [Schistocerca cancellata]|uniref:venom dipeptidyl peptidase 4-like isoform X1 n=1 Tax=Schistocerca cancellata TaxID=274614 RepID=UPI002119785E|nr:venom dipeptidyl peptidase 4-like isoform X1 [Schistocerca cancellata]
MKNRQDMAWGSGMTYQLATAAVCVVLLQSAMSASVQRQPWTLEEIARSKSPSQSMEVDWVGGPVVLVEHEGQLFSMDFEADTMKVLVPKEVFAGAGVVAARMSDDKQYVLLAYDAERVFRHGASARYMVYRIDDERENKILGRRHKIGDSRVTQIGGGKRLQLAKWGTKSQLAYVYENNIYYLTSPDAEPIQITKDGVPNVVFNGILESYAGAWSHPVKTVGQDASLLFSPDGKKLIFTQKDVSSVANARFVYYGRPGALESQYANLVTFRFPKAGTPMATVALKVASLPSQDCPCLSIQQLLAPVDVVSEDHYLNSVAWVDDNTVMAWWMNRTANVRQDVIYFLSNDVKQIAGEKGLKIEQKNGWVDIHPPYFQKGKETSTYVTILWQPHDDNVSFPHLVKVSGNSTKAITSGELTVTKIYGWAPNGTVYYQATEEGRPSTRQVLAVEEGGDPRCLSCAMTSPEGNACQRADAYFSDDFEWFGLSYVGPDPIFTWFLNTAALSGDTKLTRKSKEQRTFLKSRLQPGRLEDWVEVEGGVAAQVRLLLPPDLDPNGSQKRPAIVSVNAYPGAQSIVDFFTTDISSYFTTNRRYVYIYIDGRGSGCKGDRMLFSVYRRLGTVEVEDQISVTKWLTEKYPFIDGSRVAIWGKGYGGYAAAMALARDEDDVFKCGVSVAPVTSWIYADIRESERYMGFPTPEDNEEGYNASDVTRLAERFAGKKFLLMHGTADDKVLYQNSMALATALEEAGVLFDQQSYPDQGHGLSSVNGHVYRTIDEFFLRCFDRTPLLVDIISELIS